MESKEYKNRLMDVLSDSMSKKYGDGFITDLWDRISDELLNHILPDGKSRLYLMMFDAANYCIENGIRFWPGICDEGMMCAFLLGICSVNPMKPHYCCRCGYYEPSLESKDGFDLPDKKCPYCGNLMKGDGHDIEYYHLNPKRTYGISAYVDYSRKDEILKYLDEKYPEVSFVKAAFLTDDYYAAENMYVPVDNADDMIIADGEPCVKDEIAFSKYGVLSFWEDDSAFLFMERYDNLFMSRRSFRKLRDKKSDFCSMLGDLYPALADFSNFSEFVKCYSLFWLFETSAFRSYKNKVINGIIPLDIIPTCIEELIEMLISCGLEKSKIENAAAVRRDWKSYEEDSEPGDVYIEKFFFDGAVPEYLLCLYDECRFMNLKSAAIGKAMYFLAGQKEKSFKK